MQCGGGGQRVRIEAAFLINYSTAIRHPVAKKGKAGRRLGRGERWGEKDKDTYLITIHHLSISSSSIPFTTLPKCQPDPLITLIR
jgi:hypothetical protein